MEERDISMKNSGSDNPSTGSGQALIPVYIPTALQRFVGQQETIRLAGATVKEVLEQLSGQYPELKKHLYNEQGQLRSFVNVLVNDEDIRHTQGLDTRVAAKDAITIVPSIAGGAESCGTTKTTGLSNE